MPIKFFCPRGTAWLICAFVTASATAQEGQVGSSIKASDYEQTIYVDSGGSDSNPGTGPRPMKTIRRAIEKASRQYLSAGVETRIFVRDGVYGYCGWFGASDFDSRKKRETSLIIEGQSRDGVILDGRGKEQTLLRIAGKSNLMIHNLTIRNAKYGNNFICALTLAWGGQVDDTQNVRLENITVDGNASGGVQIHRIRYVTMRNCTVRNNGSTGVIYLAKNGRFESLKVVDNNRDDRAEFERGGMAFGGYDAIIKDCQFNNNRHGVGFRMDVASERVRLERVKCYNNDGYGFMFETAIGPTRLIDCVAADNRNAGINLSCVYDLEMKRCRFINNARTQISLVEMDRTIPDIPPMLMAADLGAVDEQDQKPMCWNRRTRLVDSFVKGKGSQTLIQCDGDTGYGWQTQYDRSNGETSTYKARNAPRRTEKWVQDEYVGRNNRFWHSGDKTRVFETDHDDIFSNFANWKSITNSDRNSRWQKFR